MYLDVYNFVIDISPCHHFTIIVYQFLTMSTSQSNMNTRSSSRSPTSNSTNVAPIDDDVGRTNVDNGVDNFSLSDYLAEVQKIESNVVRSEGDRKAMSALDISMRHYKRCHELELKFIDVIASICK